MSKVILGYWNMRGMGERIRLMMEYMGLNYENVKYPIDDKSKWFNAKFTLGLDFPNLPYIIDGSVKMTESWAIMKYLAHKNNDQLYPGSGTEEIRCNMAVGVVHDFRTNFVQMIYNPDFKNLKNSYIDLLPVKLELFDKFLQDNAWLAGEKLTYVDFALAETLTRHLMIFPGCLDKFSNVKRFHDTFLNLKPLKDYYASSRFQKYPMHLPHAQWGHGP